VRPATFRSLLCLSSTAEASIYLPPFPLEPTRALHPPQGSAPGATASPYCQLSVIRLASPFTPGISPAELLSEKPIFPPPDPNSSHQKSKTSSFLLCHPATPFSIEHNMHGQAQTNALQKLHHPLQTVSICLQHQNGTLSICHRKGRGC